MELIYPSYYKDFACIAGNCPDSCCHEWEVQVDAASATRYRAMEGALGDALREALYDEEGETFMRNKDNRCPMWRDDGLCRIQAEQDHEALCQVCRQFPRLRQDYGEFVELGLEMSCPEAAGIMLNSTGWTLISEEKPGKEPGDYDSGLMDLLRESRPIALELLAEEPVPVNVRLARLLLYGHHIQAQIDGGEVFDFDPAQAEILLDRCAGRGDYELLRGFYQELEILTQRWSDRLAGAGETPLWEEKLCRLGAYQIYRYWYQAVSDWDLAARVKLMVAGCVLLARVPGDMAGNIQLYAKEIENDAANVDAILDGAFGARALTDENLLALLSSG